VSRLPYRLDSIERASGLVLGFDPQPERAVVDPTLTPSAALQRAVLPALLRPPCLVSFSGGRDSSAVLAAATHVARREGLALPIPATNVFPAAPRTDESEWQERVVQHLGLADWARLEHADELDCIGPVARDALRRNGLLWPFNAHFHEPIIRAAAGGSLLTGIGGDELLNTGRLDRVTTVLALRARPELRDLRRIAYALAPRRLRRAALRRLGPPQGLPWLRPAAQREFVDRWARMAADEPLGWAARLRNVGACRYLRVGIQSLDVLAAPHGVRIGHPFTDVTLTEALARLPWRGRYRDRTEGLRMLVGALLPDEVLRRTSKALFDEAFWTAGSREFAAAWDGTGLDPDLVDADALRREWQSEQPLAQSYLLLQQAWLHADSRSGAQRVEQAVGGLG
jgi:asparagine synthase (glutamine-hydrolysing)